MNIFHGKPLSAHISHDTIAMNKIQGENLHETRHVMSIEAEKKLKLLLEHLVVNKIDHGDLMLQNFIYNPDTHDINLIDFGSAKLLPTSNDVIDKFNQHQGPLTRFYRIPDYLLVRQEKLATGQSADSDA